MDLTGMMTKDRAINLTGMMTAVVCMAATGWATAGDLPGTGRTVDDARSTRPTATRAFAADAAAKELTGKWISGGDVPGKVVFEETAWRDEAFRSQRWTRDRGVTVKDDGRGGKCVELRPNGTSFVTCVQGDKFAVPMKKGVPIAVLWEARTPKGGASPYFRYDIYDADGKFVSACQMRSVVDPTQPQAFHRNAFVLTPSADSRIRAFFHVTPSDPEAVEVANVRIADLGAAVADAVADDPKVLAARAAAGSGLLWFPSADLGAGYPVLPTSTRIPGEAKGALRIVECPGERTRAGIVLWSRDGMRDVSLSFSDLKSGWFGFGAKIPAAAISAKVVKCHYQGEGAPFTDVATGEGQVLVPELLLNDDSLVVPDHEAHVNFVRFAAATPFYTNVNTITEFAWSSRIPNEKMPIVDAPMLRPFDLAPGLNKQLAVTLRVPKGAKAGTYRGTLTVRADAGRVVAEIPVELTVLPFTLPEKAETAYDPSREYTMGLYTWCALSADGSPAMSPFHRSREQVLAVYRTLYEGGVHDPAFIWHSGIVYDDAKFRAHLAVAREAGFKGALHLGSSGLVGNDTNAVQLAAMKERLVRAMATAREYGFAPVYFYGFDEAYGEKLLSQRTAWKAAKETGAKIIVSGGNGHFENVGDLLDICVYHDAPENARPADWHSVGHALWKYGTPQTAPEDPRLYRRNYGLYLWHLGFDGANTYCETSGGAAWNDIVSLQRNRLTGKHGGAYRSETMLYPTLDGVVETIAFTGLESAIRDVRYLTKFRQLLREHPNAAAQKWYDSVDFGQDDPAAIRAAAIDWILRLNGR
ncbi:MAG: hypothetical protein PUJ80_11910 [Verrucomicrobiota bacterium]|nr:hypothetical protein [Verrucomicrobiota bacterium]